ncbi:hypothetical protein Hanom_Chr04g00314581 [Helianthus anomalus]
MIENNPKEKSRACAAIQDNEGFDWSEVLPINDNVDERFKTKAKWEALNKHNVFVAEIKEKSREEILKEKTPREINIAGYIIEKMQEEYEDAVSSKSWDKKREFYVNRDGEPVVHRRDIVHDDVLVAIPRSGQYHSNVAKDKTYVKRLDKIIRDVMTSSLRKRDEARMKKNVDEMVND